MLTRLCACAQLWIVDYFYLIAGILFFLSGVAYVMYEISIWLIPGARLSPALTCNNVITCITYKRPVGEPSESYWSCGQSMTTHRHLCASHVC